MTLIVIVVVRVQREREKDFVPFASGCTQSLGKRNINPIFSAGKWQGDNKSSALKQITAIPLCTFNDVERHQSWRDPDQLRAVASARARAKSKSISRATEQ